MEIQKERICIKGKGIKNPVKFKFNFVYFKPFEFAEDYYVLNSSYMELKRGIKWGMVCDLERQNLIFTNANKDNCLEQTEVMKGWVAMKKSLPAHKVNFSDEARKRQQEGTRRYNERIVKERREAKKEINEMLGCEVFKNVDRKV